MWSKEVAKHLIKKGEKSKDDLTRELAKYLGYALDTIKYYSEQGDKK